MADAPYSNEELRTLTTEDALPERGDFCPRCRKFIPSFADLSDDDVRQLMEVVAQSPAQAMRELRAKTGCNMRFAKIWVIHPTGPHVAKIHPPCPYCGKPLFSTGTRQCLSCGWDWHDKDNPKKLTSDPVQGIALGEAAIQQGRVFPSEKAKEKMKRWFARKKQAGQKSTNG